MSKILVVEDEKSMRDLLGLMLRKEGYSVATADSALQAKQLIESGESFDLVVSDVSMPSQRARVTRIASARSHAPAASSAANSP